jgi:undecaprenyl-diphosphatase
MPTLIYNRFLTIDYYFFNLLNQYASRSAILDGLAIFFAHWSAYLIIAGFLIFLWRKKVRGREKIKIFLAAFFSAVISRFGFVTLIRVLHFRARPFLSLHVNQILDHSSAEASFPSGHAAFFFAFSLTVYYYNKKLGLLFLAVIILMVLGRIFVGIHYPADVIAGAAIGIFSAWLVNKFLIF